MLVKYVSAMLNVAWLLATEESVYFMAYPVVQSARLNVLQRIVRHHFSPHFQKFMSVLAATVLLDAKKCVLCLAFCLCWRFSMQPSCYSLAIEVSCWELSFYKGLFCYVAPGWAGGHVLVCVNGSICVHALHYAVSFYWDVYLRGWKGCAVGRRLDVPTWSLTVAPCASHALLNAGSRQLSAKPSWHFG